MARFGARCSPTAAPQRIRNGARVTRFRGRVPTDQLRDAQPRKTAWQDRDEDGERHLPSYLVIRVGWALRSGSCRKTEGRGWADMKATTADNTFTGEGGSKRD